MATFKCNDPIYTILRNGKVLTMSARPATAVSAITDDASRNVCPPDCCITGFNIDIDSFDVLISTVQYQSLSIRVTVTSGGNDYSTSWVAAAATNTIDITGLIVEFGDWEDGNTICVEYSYDQETVIEGCCTTVVIPNAQFNENNTYQLSEVVTECTGGVFDLAYQNPDGGVTVDPAGEMVIPELEEDETVFVTYSCDDCVSELLILTAKNVVPLQGLRLTFDNIANVPVASASSVSDWNTFFDLPTNGTPFTGVSVAGNEVSLYGGAGITMAAVLFYASTALLKIEDDSLCIEHADNQCFSNCTSATTFTLPALLTAGEYCFLSCTSATTFTLPALTTAGTGCFKNNASIPTLSLPSLTTAGESCFEGVAGVSTFNFPALLTAGDLCFLLTTATDYILPLCTSMGAASISNCLSVTTINLSSCTNLGGTTGDNGVFFNIAGNTITITVPIALQTCDGGNPDGDLVYLAANNTATINYI